MENRLNHISPGRAVRAVEIMENILFPIKLQEQYIRLTSPPENFGVLAPDKEYRFDFGLTGNIIYLRSLHALLPSGHLVRYNAQSAGAGLLEFSVDDLAAGEYFLYLVHEDWEPVVSVQAHGKTVVPDSFEPIYKLIPDPSLKSIRKYPHCLLLGKLWIGKTATHPPTILEDVSPLISQVGAHPLPQALLQKTKAQAKELIKASEQILSQLQLTPPNSIFRDIKLLAEDLLTYLSTTATEVKHWDKHTHFFDLYCFWAAVATVFQRRLDSDLATQRLHSHELLHRSGVRAGQIQMEHYLTASIDQLLKHDFALDDNSKTISLLEQFIAYPILAWLKLGDGTPIPIPAHRRGNQHQIKTITR